MHNLSYQIPEDMTQCSSKTSKRTNKTYGPAHAKKGPVCSSSNVHEQSPILGYRHKGCLTLPQGLCCMPANSILVGSGKTAEGQSCLSLCWSPMWQVPFSHVLFHIRYHVKESSVIIICPLKGAPNKDSNKPAHLRSLITVFVVRMMKFCILGYPNRICKT